MKQHVVLDIPVQTILKVIGVLVGLWFLFLIRDILLLLFIVIIIVMALAPIVNKWQRHMPRALAVGILFFIIISVMSLVISLIIPPLVSQVGELSNSLPGYVDQIRTTIDAPANSNFTVAEQAVRAVSDQLSSLSTNLIQATLGVLGGFVTFLTIIVLSIYLLFEEKGIRNFIVSLTPSNSKHRIVDAIDKVGDKLGAWLRGQLLLMVIIGITVTIISTALGLPYALTLGLWGGITEAIPFIGPIIGGVPVVLLAFAESPIKGIIAIVLLTLVQQLEANFIVPKVMQRAVGLSPVIVILALLIGGKLFGITGTILSVPFAAAISVVLQDWSQFYKVSRTKKEEIA